MVAVNYKPDSILFVFLFAFVLSTAACSRGSDESIPRRDGSPATTPDKNRRSNSDTQTLSGVVVSVVDGDTIEILDDERTSHRIRLKGIDAPEGRQAFGNVSRENLARLVAGKKVSIEWEKLDQYNRIVGKVYVNGTDVCLEQIKAGLAWHFKRFVSEQSASDQQTYAQAELEARSQQLGLWRDSSQIPPWDFRRVTTERD
jgi:endonuclease YncB( thermonuclease family)